MYSAGAFGMEPLADEETLVGAGVAQDGSAEFDVVLANVKAKEARKLGRIVCIPASVLYLMLCVLIIALPIQTLCVCTGFDGTSCRCALHAVMQTVYSR